MSKVLELPLGLAVKVVDWLNEFYGPEMSFDYDEQGNGRASIEVYEGLYQGDIKFPKREEWEGSTDVRAVLEFFAGLDQLERLTILEVVPTALRDEINDGFHDLDLNEDVLETLIRKVEGFMNADKLDAESLAFLDEVDRNR